MRTHTEYLTRTTHRIDTEYWNMYDVQEIWMFDWDTDNDMLLWYDKKTGLWTATTRNEAWCPEVVVRTERFCDAFSIAFEVMQYEYDELTQLLNA